MSCCSAAQRGRGSRVCPFFFTLPRLSSRLVPLRARAAPARPFPLAAPHLDAGHSGGPPVGLTPTAPARSAPGTDTDVSARSPPPPLPLPPPASWRRGRRRWARVDPGRPSWPAWSPPARSRRPRVCASGWEEEGSFTHERGVRELRGRGGLARAGIFFPPSRASPPPGSSLFARVPRPPTPSPSRGPTSMPTTQAGFLRA